MKDIVIEANGLTRRFGELVAVRDVTFRVRRGAIFGLLGPNGSGKSTIIRMLLGILPPTAGSATMLGHDAYRAAEAIKPRVGYMSQKFSLYTDLSVRENVEFYGRVYGLEGERLQQRLAAVLELTDLGAYVDNPAGTLSGGWQRRLGLACALVHEPEVLFLDEPTAGIDPVARRHLWDLLFQLSGQGVTLFVTTHYMDEAERCTDVGYIYLSKLLVLGKPDELKALPEVTPAGSRRVEMSIPHASSHLAALRGITEVQDATLFGDTVHALVSDSRPVADIVGQLELPSDAVACREISPTLEDVFVTLTARAQSQSEATAPARPVTATSETHTSPAASTVQPEPPGPPDGTGMSPSGLWAVLVKEFLHIRRQPSTLFFMLLVPVMQTIIFGYAIDTQIENIPTVVFDLDGRHYAREYLAALENTRRFEVTEYVYDEASFQRALTSGQARVGVRIPPSYSDRILRGEQVQVQVLIDGSDSQVALTAQSTSQLLGLNQSVALARAKGERLQIAPARDPQGHGVLPIETRTRMLYNPDLESAHFFVPGLVGIILQLVTLFLTSFAIVRERELGTLEQLFVTPVGRLGLLLGKLVPYAVLGFIEMLIILCVMVYVFRIPIHGSITLLLLLSMLFMVCSLGLGLLVSTLAKSQLEAIQFAFIIMLPSVLLSGFMFPRSEMPFPIYLVTFCIPVTYFIEILRGIVLRGADLGDLLPAICGLAVCGVLVLWLSVLRFQKRLS